MARTLSTAPSTIDFGYAAHRRTVNGISGLISEGNRSLGTVKGAPFVTVATTTILENRVNGSLRSVTVLDANGRATARLDGPTARYA